MHFNYHKKYQKCKNKESGRGTLPAEGAEVPGRWGGNVLGGLGDQPGAVCGCCWLLIKEQTVTSTCGAFSICLAFCCGAVVSKTEVVSPFLPTPRVGGRPRVLEGVLSCLLSPPPTSSPGPIKSRVGNDPRAEDFTFLNLSCPSAKWE